MASNEDCASVLEQFIHDVANLPAEINHMMEEIHAKDKDSQKLVGDINAKDSNIQKYVKLNGSLLPHPKEKEFSEVIMKNYDQCLELQSQKIGLSDKACVLLDRQIKKLDMKIRELQNDGQLVDGPPIPSLFNRKIAYPESQKPFHSDLLPASSLPLQVASNNAMNIHHNAQSRAGHHPSVQPLPRQVSQIQTTLNVISRNSAPATPASTAPHQNRAVRESSAGPTDSNKKRRLNAAHLSTTIPTLPSSLRQSSLGPNGIVTPKPGTPTGASRAGSIPRAPTATAIPTSQVPSASANPKKASTISKKVAPHHQQVSKLKGKPSKHQSRLSGIKKRSSTRDSPSNRSRGGTADEEDTTPSSASPSDTDTHASGTRSRRGASSTANNNASSQTLTQKHKAARHSEEEEADADMEDVDAEGDADEDDRRYCFCNEKSYGEMVACENDESCPYEWFHLKCVGMTSADAPGPNDVWLCPACSKRDEIRRKYFKK